MICFFWLPLPTLIKLDLESLPSQDLVLKIKRFDLHDIQRSAMRHFTYQYFKQLDLIWMQTSPRMSNMIQERNQHLWQRPCGAVWHLESFATIAVVVFDCKEWAVLYCCAGENWQDLIQRHKSFPVAESVKVTSTFDTDSRTLTMQIVKWWINEIWSTLDTNFRKLVSVIFLVQDRKE